MSDLHPETTQSHSFDRLRTSLSPSMDSGLYSAKKATLCHPEPFDGLRIDSAKDLEILRRPAICGTPQNDTQNQGFRMETN